MTSSWDPSESSGPGYEPPRYEPPQGPAPSGDYGISFGGPGQATPPPGTYQPPSAPAGYGYAAPGYPPGVAPPVEHPKGTTVLVLGILSLVVCQLLGPFAWIMGNSAMAEIKRSHRPVSNRGSVQAGRICGMISTILMVGLIVLFLLVAVLGSEA